MIIIADSGSTKTHWALVHSDAKPVYFKSNGLNPYHLKDESIIFELQHVRRNLIRFESVEKLYFYGSGCSVQQADRMRKLLENIFCPALCEVHSDMLGAARALFHNSNGIASILGTGSNSAIYENKNLVKSIESMGYILGDEGSGAVLGKSILLLWLRNQFDKELLDSWNNLFSFSHADIRNNLYQKSFPNRFLASFSVFAYENRNHPTIKNLIYNHFNDYFKYQLLNISNSDNYKLGIVGSIGYYFQDIIAELAQNFNFELEVILKDPISELIKFHSYEL